MLKDAFFNVYTKFKLHFYQEIFSRFQDREASLTTVETFCMEAIQALGSPTVNEFATFMRISPPNAAYKVNSLIKKGYIRKVQSSDDRREYHLEITQKYIDYYNNRRIKLKLNGLSPVQYRIQTVQAAYSCFCLTFGGHFRGGAALLSIAAGGRKGRPYGWFAAA